MYNFDEICRVCLCENDLQLLSNNFEEDHLLIYEVFNEYTPIKITKNDGLPFKICNNCYRNLKEIYDFINKCKETLEILNEYLLMKIKKTEDNDSKNQKILQTKKSEKKKQKIYYRNMDDSNDTIQFEPAETFESDVESVSPIKSEIYDSELQNNFETVLSAKYEIFEKDEDKIRVKGEPNLDNHFKMDIIKKPKKKKFECKKCSLSFESRKSLVDHWSSLDHKSRPYGKKQCPICQKDIAYRRISQHLKIHSNNVETFICDICSKMYNTLSNLRRHVTEKHENVRKHFCEKCNRSFTRKQILINHKCFVDGPQLHYDNLELDNNFRKRKKMFIKLNCQKCDRLFRGSGALKMHMKRVHERYQNTQNFEKNNMEPNFVQNASVFDGSDINVKKNHQNIISESSENCACDRNTNPEGQNICNCKNGNEKVTNNTEEFISKQIKYLCAKCGRGFSNKVLLQSHSVVHSDERPHCCTLCQKSFSRITTLEVHMRSHTGERPFQCMDCGKRFSQQTHLRYHKRTHSGERPFECPTCQKRFSLKGTLTVHIRTHTGERPYKCRYCDSAFYDSSSAKKHERQNHPNVIINQQNIT